MNLHLKKVYFLRFVVHFRRIDRCWKGETNVSESSWIILDTSRRRQGQYWSTFIYDWWCWSFLISKKNSDISKTISVFKITKLTLTFLDEVWSHLERRSFLFCSRFFLSSSDSTWIDPLIVIAFNLGGVGPSKNCAMIDLQGYKLFLFESSLNSDLLLFF